MADSMRDQPPRAGFLARLNAIETLVLAIIALCALAGLMLVGKGFYLKSRAEVSLQGYEAQIHHAQG